MFIIFDRDRETALSYRQRLYRNRMHSVFLAQEEADRVPDFPAHAILLPHPNLLEDPIGFCALLRKKYPLLPVAMIYRQSSLNYYHLQNACDILFDEKTTVPKIIGELYTLYEDKGNRSPLSRISDCVRTDRRSSFIYVLGEPFLPSHTQWMLVRYLTLAAPRAVPVDELLDVGFLPGRARSHKNVSAQLTQLDRVIFRGFGFRVFVNKHPSSYFIRITRSK
ncbi:MAG: hypothetical protein IJ009_07305 [Clostridia bacterium]|nr:hypothetical protein [Clostridia bacterium]